MKTRKIKAAVRSVSRRDALRAMGGVVAVAPLTLLFGCEDESSSAEADAGSGGAGAGSVGQGGAGGRGGSEGAGSGGQSGAGRAGASGAAAGSGSATEWATGGTAAMIALASYRNPFDGDAADSCELSCALTEGPCHDDQAPEREDISQGEAGLPMRFGLRILDDNCEPVTDADVDIWHCDTVGVYSSETADSPAFCTGDNAEALKKRYFRGHRATDENGVAWFSSCFPGWYASRAIHIHFTVRRSSRAGDEYLTSQLAFSEDLIEEICSTHPDYSGHGQPDTANTGDTVFSADTVDDYVLNTERMSDGALLAWRTIIIRSSLSTTLCGGGGSGPGAMGGPPPP